MENKNTGNIDKRISLLSATLNAIEEGILVKDLDGRVVFYNTKFLEIWSLTGYSAGEPGFDETITRATALPEKEKVLAGSISPDKDQSSFESRDVLQFDNGKFIERFARPEALDGKVIAHVWSFKDITESIITQKQLSREKDLLQALMDNIPDCIYFKDASSKFIRINKAEAGLLGIEDPNEALGKTDFDYFEPEHAKAAFEDEQKVMLNKKGMIAKAEKIRRAGKEYIWVTATKVPILDKDNNVSGLVGISRDITSSKLDEEKLRKYSEELDELNKSKDKFFSILAHDLRSPLSPLLGLSEILAKDFESLSNDEIKLFSKDIYDAVKSQFDLLENLLSWSRMQTGKMECEPERINISEDVERVISLLKGNAKNKNITINNSVDKNLLAFADPNMFHSVLQNLLSNAIKFTYTNGVIKIYSTVDSGFIELTVEDNGIGIKPQNIKNIFGLNCFSTNGTNQEKGTGLGLIICKEMVERNGGRIRVESEINKGSKFIFTVPEPE